MPVSTRMHMPSANLQQVDQVIANLVDTHPPSLPDKVVTLQIGHMWQMSLERRQL